MVNFGLVTRWQDLYELHSYLEIGDIIEEKSPVPMMYNEDGSEFVTSALIHQAIYIGDMKVVHYRRYENPKLIDLVPMRSSSCGPSLDGITPETLQKKFPNPDIFKQILPRLLNSPGKLRVFEDNMHDHLRQHCRSNNGRDKSEGCWLPFDDQQIVARAKGRIGEERFSPETNNCEHFVNWVRYGKKESAQVQKAQRIVDRVNGMNFQSWEDAFAKLRLVLKEFDD